MSVPQPSYSQRILAIVLRQRVTSAFFVVSTASCVQGSTVCFAPLWPHPHSNSLIDFRLISLAETLKTESCKHSENAVVNPSFLVIASSCKRGLSVPSGVQTQAKNGECVCCNGLSIRAFLTASKSKDTLLVQRRSPKGTV